MIEWFYKQILTNVQRTDDSILKQNFQKILKNGILPTFLYENNITMTPKQEKDNIRKNFQAKHTYKH